jgi:hypothetical protein
VMLFDIVDYVREFDKKILFSIVSTSNVYS